MEQMQLVGQANALEVRRGMMVILTDLVLEVNVWIQGWFCGDGWIDTFCVYMTVVLWQVVWRWQWYSDRLCGYDNDTVTSVNMTMIWWQMKMHLLYRQWYFDSVEFVDETDISSG